MARVQLIIPDEDRDRFVRQARGEGLTLSAWLRAAARNVTWKATKFGTLMISWFLSKNTLVLYDL